MSRSIQEHQEVEKRWYQKKRIWYIAGIIVLLLGTGLLIFTYVGFSKIPDVGGGLTIEADPDTRIYIGDKLVGTTQVTLPWAELFGDEKHQPVAIELPDLGAKVTPELVSGAGAKILDSQRLGGGGQIMMLKVTPDRYMIRRSDGALDEVLAYSVELTNSNKQRGRILVPVRLRKGKGPTTVYFKGNGGGMGIDGGYSGSAFRRAFGKSPTEMNIHGKFTAGTPPGQFAEEIKTKGLWEPGGEK